MIKIKTKWTFVFLVSCFLSSSVYAVSLQNVVIDVLKKHPRLLAAKAEKMVDQYALSQAQADYLPKMQLKLGRGTEVSGNAIVRSSVLTQSVQLNRQEQSLRFNQMLFDGFKTRAAINGQLYNLQSDSFKIGAEAQALIQQVAEAYLNVLRARELILLARSNIRVHEKTLANIRLRFQGGAGTRGEIQLAESRLALAKVGIGSAQGRLEQANAAYFALVTKPAPLIMQRPPSVRRYLPKSKAIAVKQAMRLNPQINRSKAKMASANQGINEAKANMFPKINLEVNASDNNNLDGIAGRNYELSAMLVMNYTVFNGGQDLAELKKARQRKLQNLHLVNTTRRDVLSSVTRAWAQWQEYLNVYQFYRSYVNKQKDVVKDYKQQFSLGKRALFNVLDAENELFRARVGLTESYYNAKIDTYKVLARVGILSPKIV